MIDVEDELWRNVMSWWASIPVTGHVGMPVDRGFRFESDCGHFKDDPLPDGKPVQLLPQTSGAHGSWSL